MNRHLRCILCALILMAVLAGPGRAYAQEAGQKTYIVRFADALGTEGDQPSRPAFDVVDRATLRLLQREGALAWYEEDSAVYLPDAEGQAEPKSSGGPDSGSLAGGQPAGSLADASEESPYWQLRLMDAQPKEGENPGEGVRVAVIDSGAADHPALAHCLQAGWNYIDDTEETPDSNGHGTAVCGLIAGLAENGAMGAAPGAAIVPLKCFDGTTTKTSLICEAICDAVDVYDCSVINLSVGVRETSSNLAALQEAVD